MTATNPIEDRAKQLAERVTFEVWYVGRDDKWNLHLHGAASVATAAADRLRRDHRVMVLEVTRRPSDI